MTLHGSVGHVKGDALRARNVLQNGVKDWISKCDFSSFPKEQIKRAEGMLRRLIDLRVKTKEVGYSLKD
jgi:nicotinamide N-methyltransferase